MCTTTGTLGSTNVANNVCNVPLIELSQESCNNGLGFDKFQMQSSKKINWKKPINGKIRFKLRTTSGKSDVLKLKKCVKIASGFSDRAADLTEVTAYFQENVPRNEATLLYTNGTTVYEVSALDQ